MNIRTFLAALLLAASPQAAHAWGAFGHSAVALIAEPMLTPQAKANVRQLLLGAPLVTGAVFADEYRVSHPETDRWHYVDIPDDQTNYVPARDCELRVEGDCILAAMEREKKIIVDPEAGIFDRADALKRLVHWVGDIHQPFHATERTVNGKPDRGGNEFRVRLFDAPSGTNTNMHALWDTGMIMRGAPLVEDTVHEIVTTIVPAILPGEKNERDPLAWALASHAAAHGAYFPDVSGTTDIIDQAYLDANLPIAKRQLGLAGIHLANLLNELLAQPLQ